MAANREPEQEWHVVCECGWSCRGSGCMGGTNTLTRHRIYAHPQSVSNPAEREST